ncbi:GNAT family N-acetyltransferase [Marinilactibacillus piezotolerans]|uniref:GNAT family N-acetyltransferase n=1 Tax=Marinilactibacillus piezotolerans TaxID=258723 RepID=UPI0009B14463|nr:GNAT family N-acetyltransferase [Marinilactibacillus piezotolerans]
METRQITSERYASYVQLFMSVFNQPPWNDQWTKEKAALYLKDIFNTPGFIGVEALKNNQPVAVVIGNHKHWWSGDEFFIQEMFVSKAEQGKGIGKELFKYLTVLLEERNISNLSLLTDKGIDAEYFYKANGMKQIERLIFFSKEI